MSSSRASGKTADAKACAVFYMECEEPSPLRPMIWIEG
jgi:hypothetical protein